MSNFDKIHLSNINSETWERIKHGLLSVSSQNSGVLTDDQNKEITVVGYGFYPWLDAVIKTSLKTREPVEIEWRFDKDDWGISYRATISGGFITLHGPTTRNDGDSYLTKLYAVTKDNRIRELAPIHQTAPRTCIDEVPY